MAQAPLTPDDEAVMALDFAGARARVFAGQDRVGFSISPPPKWVRGKAPSPMLPIDAEVARLDRNGGIRADGRAHALSADAMKRFGIACPYYAARRAVAFAGMAAHHEWCSKAATTRLSKLEKDTEKLATKMAEFLEDHAPEDIGWAVSRPERSLDMDFVAKEIATQEQFAALRVAILALGSIGARAEDARSRLAPRGAPRLTWHVAFVRAMLLPWFALTGVEAATGDDNPFARFIDAAYATLGGSDRGWGSQIETAIADVADWPRWGAFDFTGTSRDPAMRTYPNETAAEIGISRMRERMLQTAGGSRTILENYCDLQLAYARAALGDFSGRFEDTLRLGAAIKAFQNYVITRGRTEARNRVADLSGSRSPLNP